MQGATPAACRSAHQTAAASLSSNTRIRAAAGNQVAVPGSISITISVHVHSPFVAPH